MYFETHSRPSFQNKATNKTKNPVSIIENWPLVAGEHLYMAISNKGF